MGDAVSEGQFQRELDQPGGSYGGADSTRAANNSTTGRENPSLRYAEIGPVEDVKEFSPKFQISTFEDGASLCEREIEIR